MTKATSSRAFHKESIRKLLAWDEKNSGKKDSKYHISWFQAVSEAIRFVIEDGYAPSEAQGDFLRAAAKRLLEEADLIKKTEDIPEEFIVRGNQLLERARAYVEAYNQ